MKSEFTAHHSSVGIAEVLYRHYNAEKCPDCVVEAPWAKILTAKGHHRTRCPTRCCGISPPDRACSSQPAEHSGQSTSDGDEDPSADEDPIADEDPSADGEGTPYK